MAEVYFVVCCLSASYPTAPALDPKGSWAFMVCSWSQGSGNPRPHREWQSPEAAAELVVTCGLYHLLLCNADIPFGSWVRLEKNVFNDFNEVC